MVSHAAKTVGALSDNRSGQPQLFRPMTLIILAILGIGHTIFLRLTGAGGSLENLQLLKDGSREQVQLENATLFMLVRNSELGVALHSMRQIEDRFNHKYHYPWTFLNDVPFDEKFIKYTSGIASGKTEYGLIPRDHWDTPKDIDTRKYNAAIQKLAREKIPYGNSHSYRRMCRFFSGYFAQHDLMKQYQWYWRVEPEIQFHCNIEYDPFKFMRTHDKAYGFVMSMMEYPATVPSLWNTTKAFFDEHPEHLASDNADFIVTDDRVGLNGTYNYCHFWSNFEIGSLKFFRSEAYTDYFNFLDSQKGFFYERWGDAPIHSLAVSLMLPKDKLHFFSDIGYHHAPWGRCPSDDESHVSGRCQCSRTSSFDYMPLSCLARWLDNTEIPKGAEFYARDDDYL